jgi:hypothetical protein
MDTVQTVCSRCGAEMTQNGAENGKTRYHCSFCGNTIYVDMSVNDNAEYWDKRSALLGRVRLGIVEWKTTPWEYLSRDIITFTSSYQDAAEDVCFKIAIIACITSGFQNMTEEKYRECNRIFKLTEKIYKNHQKDKPVDPHCFPHDEDVRTYKEYRTMYKKCRNEYRNTKLLWKACFTVGKKLLFFKPF